jgi:hypothetical protein
VSAISVHWAVQFPSDEALHYYPKGVRRHWEAACHTPGAVHLTENPMAVTCRRCLRSKRYPRKHRDTMIERTARYA